MSHFTDELASYWPSENQVQVESIEELWRRRYLYETIYDDLVVKMGNLPEPLLRMWLYTAGAPSASEESEPERTALLIPPEGADELSGIPPEMIEFLRTELENQFDILDGFTMPKEPIQLQEVEMSVLKRGTNAIAELTPRLRTLLEKRRSVYAKDEPRPAKWTIDDRILNAALIGRKPALEEMERFMLQRYNPIPTTLPTAYYKLIRDRYGVRHHLLASPATAFYPIYGSHNTKVNDDEVDYYGNVGDVLRDVDALRTLLDIAADEQNVGEDQLPSINLELNTLHMGAYAPVAYKILINELLSTELPALIFVVGSSTVELPSVLSSFVKATRSIDSTRNLIILSNETDREAQPFWKNEEEIQDILICLGALYVAPLKTIPRLTVYEKTVAIGKRAIGLSQGDEMVLKDVSYKEIDLLNIAEMEFDRKVLPMEVVRNLPNGAVEIVNPNENRY